MKSHRTHYLGLFIVSALTAFWLMGPSKAQASGERGKIYRDSAKPETLMFLFVRKNQVAADKSVTSDITYTYPDGTIAVKESLVVSASGDILAFTRDQKQLNEHGRIDVTDQLKFSYTRAGNEKTESEDKVRNFVVGPSIADFIQKNWQKIMSGENMSVRLGVVDRLETVGFDYKKVREEKFQGEDVVVIRMKPTSFIIATLVDPLHLSFNKATKHLRRIQGRVIPLEKTANKYKDLDGDFIFD